MFSYDSQREGGTFGHGDATRGFHFGALYCGAGRTDPKSGPESDVKPPNAGAGGGGAGGPDGRTAF